ncbi:glycine cleavage system protein T [Polymorphobacter glacialis]|uniref:Glycine cleavage system protein T n=2 Tax=Sandarakinorhabdus glacialis TaxID=1614636 RepID=A0A916ZSJ1_9SPHN|nr:glycine cleavage system protein T [Polymorphobacter glacialis]
MAARGAKVKPRGGKPCISRRFGKPGANPYSGAMTIVQLEDRAVLRIAGADTRPFLQGLLTADVDTLAPDRPLYAGLLSPQGKALFDMLLFADGDDVFVDVAAARVAALAKRLAMYRMRKAVTIETSLLAVFAGWDGGEAGQAPDARFAGLGARWLAEDAGEAGAAVYDVHRLAVGVPGSADIGEDQLLWLETGADLLNGVSFTKGCYVGQENTARMHYRDKVRRRLVPVRFAGDPGDGIVRDGAGRIAGTLRSHRGGAGIAHLRLEAAGGPLSLGGAPMSAERPAWLEAALLAAVGPAVIGDV